MGIENKFIDFCNCNFGLSYDEEKKAEFKKLGKQYLKALVKVIEERCKFIEYKIDFNPMGIAVSGDHYLMGMFSEDRGINVFFGLSTPDLGICYRTITHKKDYTGGGNQWIKFNEARNLDLFADRIIRLCKLGG